MNNSKKTCPKCSKNVGNNLICPFCGSGIPQNVQKRRFHTVLWVTVPSIVVLSIMTFAWFALASRTNINTGINNVSESQEVMSPLHENSSEIVVPNLAGLDFEKMQQSFSSNGEFRLLLSNKEFSETVTAGCIISQTPEKGSSVSRGSVIAVVVSLGTKNIPLPNTSGLTFSEISFKLRSAGFKVQKTEQYSQTVPEGHVIGYENFVGGKTAEYGSEINVIVSLGPKR